MHTSSGRAEIVAGLEDSMISLFTSFRERNAGRVPARVIVYRDGVGDGQFNEVLDRELVSIRGALDCLVGTYIHGYGGEHGRFILFLCSRVRLRRRYLSSSVRSGTRHALRTSSQMELA